MWTTCGSRILSDWALRLRIGAVWFPGLEPAEPTKRPPPTGLKRMAGTGAGSDGVTLLGASVMTWTLSSGVGSGRGGVKLGALFGSTDMTTHF
jgi:hypothetical protein